MFDPLSLATGAGILTAGFLVGRLARRRGPQAPAVPTCGCGHPMALHDRGTDECHGEIRRPHYYKTGERSGYEWAPCRCRRYLGPDHIADVWAPPITGSEG